MTAIAPPRFDVGQIFRQHAGSFLAKHGVNTAQLRVINAIMACRTSKLGGHLQVCESCDHALPVYNSCRNRHCPKCQNSKQAVWLEQRAHTILDTHYFHVVMTLPEQMRDVVKANPRALLGVLMRSAASTLMTLGADPKRLGATLGVTTVLHTWTRALQYHPHVHCIVTGGGIANDGERWIATRPGFLFPADVIRRLFRGRFMAALLDLYDKKQLVFKGRLAELTDPAVFRRFKEKLYDQDWVVYAKAPFAGAKHVFAYLGRYTHRVGLTNSRIKNVTDEAITIATKQAKTTTLEPLEFMRRLLLHVLPPQFVKIRHYGIFSGKRVRVDLPRARSFLDAIVRRRAPEEPRSNEHDAEPFKVPRIALADCRWERRLFLLTGIDVSFCRRCGLRTITCNPLPRGDTS